MRAAHALASEAGQLEWLRSRVDLRMLVVSTLGAMECSACNVVNVTIDGPQVYVAPRQAQPLAMILAEWFTNSCKYGAHSVTGGELEVRWETLHAADTTRVRLLWRERGGPPIGNAGAPSLGTELVRGLVARELRGRCSLGLPTGGAEHVIEFPL